MGCDGGDFGSVGFFPRKSGVQNLVGETIPPILADRQVERELLALGVCHPAVVAAATVIVAGDADVSLAVHLVGVLVYNVSHDARSCLCFVGCNLHQFVGRGKHLLSDDRRKKAPTCGASLS